MPDPLHDPPDPSLLHAPTAAEAGVLRPTRVEVNLDQLAANLRAIRAHVGGRPLMPVLKANAYGHGLVPVARRMEAEGADILAVAYLEEGILLRRAGIRCPILVLGGVVGEQIPLFLQHDLRITASSVAKLDAVQACAAAAGATATVHLKVDTGMERVGVHWYSAAPLLEASLRCPNVHVEGIYSHLANSDLPEDAPTRLQIERFAEVLRFYEQRSLPAPLRHLANSGGVLQHPDTWLDMVRPGILLYGVLPAAGLPCPIPVGPALRWTSRVVYFKVVPAGAPVSYGSTWAPAVDTRVITVPVGYGDGYFRAMSGKAEVLVGGRRCPVVGRICMDQLMVDIGQGSAYNGDEVILLGGEGGAAITADALAGWAGTIAYEVLTNINTRVPRRYLPAAPAAGA
jgi:alanine racemase